MISQKNKSRILKSIKNQDLCYEFKTSKSADAKQAPLAPVVTQELKMSRVCFDQEQQQFDWLRLFAKIRNSFFVKSCGE